MKIIYTGPDYLDLTPRQEYDTVGDDGVYVMDDVGERNFVPEDYYVVSSEGRGLGLKHDAGKPQARLIFEGFPHVLSGLTDVLTFGAGKYAPHSWQHVENGIDRYNDAAARHMLKRLKGEEVDDESGLDHELHELINRMFVLELKLREKANGTD